MKQRLEHVESLLLPMLVLVCLASCEPSVPDRYIQPGKMEDILYDYHLAEGMLQEHKSDSLTMMTYKAAVLQKHHRTEDEFEQSLAYYVRHTSRLHEMYKHLSERLGNEALAQGISVNDLNQFGEGTAKGDTANLWRTEPLLLLTDNAPNNCYSYEQKADTSFHAGDKVILDFNAMFIQKDGFKRGTALLAVRFANDSVVVRTLHMQSSTHYTMQVEDQQRLGIKSIKGFFLFEKNLQDEPSPSMVRLMVLSGIRLVRMRVPTP